MKNRWSLSLLLCMVATAVVAQSAGLQLAVQSSTYKPGDTIRFTATYPEWKAKGKLGTINLFMEDVDHQAFWRLRYPVLEGEASGELVLPDNMPGNYYALHFMLQDDFFSIAGRVLSDYKEREMNLLVMLANEQLLNEKINVDNSRTFSMKKMLFADQAKLFFTPSRARRRNDLQVQLKISLDSTYKPVDDTMTLIAIGTPPMATPPADYRFSPVLLGDEEGTLKGVEVIAKRKTLAERFEERRVTGMFKSLDAMSFEGIESNQFVGWRNVLEWLKGRVAGLKVESADNMINYNLTWREGQTLLFLNEMPVDAETLTMVPMGDIAYVKVMRPPFYGPYQGGAGGAVCVYTKDGNEVTLKGPRHSFVVNGYTPETFKLPIKGR